ncbi:rod shape-determining protein RodA [Clostridium sp. 'deep sea']|uniref:rod shape-determining protein RodA n=1 Tax=Clostridium sp. 'deep sea' TaxID=2779445 RepID=UPI001896743C|nr:rod shape-determining protein RodA [Clostridium sp. 'deep sea']QOR36335.1 rod shape-determining protein RodA [Clostridium sp. 'deep sea']
MFDFEKRLLKNVDWGIVVIFIILTIVGLLAISATTSGGQGLQFTSSVKRQVMWIAISLVALIVILCIDYHFFNNAAYLIYAVTILVLIAVFVIGVSRNGARRWIIIAGIQIQPSEFAKIAIVLSLARLLSQKRDRLHDIVGLGMFLGFALVPIVLILKEPDLGTSLVVLFIVAVMFFVAGLPWKYITIAGIGSVVAAPIAWIFMRDYQKNRILTFLNPERDKFGSAYNVIQSRIAIGSGNWQRLTETGTYVYNVTGKGLFSPDSMTGLKFIPFQYTDFIFSALGEGFGFLGSALIVILFLTLVYKSVKIAMKAKDLYGALVVSGLSAMFLFHILENIGMNLGLMPVTGLPLPFISLGGSSFLANTIALGIILNIGMRHKKIQF